MRAEPVRNLTGIIRHQRTERQPRASPFHVKQDSSGSATNRSAKNNRYSRSPASGTAGDLQNKPGRRPEGMEKRA